MKTVDEKTKLRIRPDERVPPPEHAKAVPVPDELWEKNDRRRDTADGHVDEDAPQE